MTFSSRVLKNSSLMAVRRAEFPETTRTGRPCTLDKDLPPASRDRYEGRQRLFKQPARPLKIVHLDTGVNLRGGQRPLLKLARLLRQRGHRQIIVCRDSSLRSE